MRSANSSLKICLNSGRPVVACCLLNLSRMLLRRFLMYGAFCLLPEPSQQMFMISSRISGWTSSSKPLSLLINSYKTSEAFIVFSKSSLFFLLKEFIKVRTTFAFFWFRTFIISSYLALVSLGTFSSSSPVSLLSLSLSQSRMSTTC